MYTRINVLAISATALLAFFTGCASEGLHADLQRIYGRAALHHDAQRNPVIVIPGITGTRLIQAGNGQVVWGAFGGGSADPRRPVGARLIALPMDLNRPLRDLTDDIVTDGVLDRVKVSLFGVPVELKAYAQILDTLGAGGYRDQQLALAGAVDYGDQHFTCFQFDYDWRRDNVENAARLQRFILEKREYVQGEYARRFGVGDADVKFDIVAHSMGGLVARYFLMYGDADLPDAGTPLAPSWAGARYVERAILVGTPNAGSIKALAQLVDGVDLGATLPRYEPAILGTMPAVYQLLPRARHGVLAAASGSASIDLLDPDVWERYGWGLAAADQAELVSVLLPNVKDPQERRQIALDHQARCLRRAAAFHAALDAPAVPPAGLEFYLVAGDAAATPATAIVAEAAGRVKFVGYEPGDGTVLRSSALLDERTASDWQPELRSPIRWHGVHFLFRDHLGMTQDAEFSDNVLHLLLEKPRRRAARAEPRIANYH